MMRLKQFSNKTVPGRPLLPGRSWCWCHCCTPQKSDDVSFLKTKTTGFYSAISSNLTEHVLMFWSVLNHENQFTRDNGHRSTDVPQLLSCEVLDQAADQGALSNFWRSDNHNDDRRRLQRRPVHQRDVMFFGLYVLGPAGDLSLTPVLRGHHGDKTCVTDLWKVLAIRTADWTAKALGLRLRSSSSVDAPWFFSFFFSAFGPLCFFWCFFCSFTFPSILSTAALKRRTAAAKQNHRRAGTSRN